MRLSLILLCLLLGDAALACGPDDDCPVGTRSYRLYLPAAPVPGPIGAIVFAHGYKGTGAGQMRNMALRGLADDLGVALIALDAGADDWKLAHTPQQPEATEASEAPYVTAVLADAATRFPLDRTRSVMAGFSAGGMMTWTMACELSTAFAGFVPMSGTLWAPEPTTCTSPPTNIIHIHGTRDSTVPLGGRAIGATRQGDVSSVLAMYAAYGGYQATGQTAAPGGMTCAQSANADGLRLDFCTFDGGHDFSVDRLRHGYLRAIGAE